MLNERLVVCIQSTYTVLHSSSLPGECCNRSVQTKSIYMLTLLQRVERQCVYEVLLPKLIFYDGYRINEIKISSLGGWLYTRVVG